MIIKKVKAILLAAAMMVSLVSCSVQESEKSKEQHNNDRETVYQVALLQSLTQGYYDGIIKVSELKKHGDIGIGTFEGVNGEMIVVDGVCYKSKQDVSFLPCIPVSHSRFSLNII